MKKKTTQWTTRGFEAFRAGTFGNGGHNLYVSRRGVLQRIYQYDLNHNGYFDLVFSNCQPHHESAPAYVYSRDGETPVKLPSMGNISGLAVDLTGDGHSDIVLAAYSDAAAPFAASDIYFGSDEGYSENRHIRIPTPFATSVAAGRFDGGARPALAFALTVYKTVRVFYQKGLCLEWLRFTDLPIECSQLAAGDLDGDGYDELIVRMGDSPDTTIYWGGPDGINVERFTVVPGVPADQTVPVNGTKTNPSPLESRRTGERLLQCVLYRSQWLFTLSTGKKVIFFGADKQRQVTQVFELEAGMANAVAMADLDGDGHEEAVVATNTSDPENPSESELSYIYWGGADGFSEERRSAIKTARASDVAILSRDEFVVAQGECHRHYDNDALIFQVKPNHEVILADRKHGGYIRRVFPLRHPGRASDILLVNTHDRSSVGCDHANIYWGGPDGFRADRCTQVPAWCGVDSIYADLDDDGWAELVVCNNSEESLDLDPGHHVHHFGPEGFQPEKSYTLEVKGGWGGFAADLNRNGYLDIVTVCNHYCDIKIFHGGPDGFTPEILSLEGRGSPRWIVGVDLNKNGYLDLVVPLITTDRTLIFWGGPEGYSMANHSELAVYKGVCVHAADLTKNGYPDLLIGTHTQTPSQGELTPHDPHHSFLHIYWNGPEGLSENNKCILRGDAVDSIAVADFNNDGWLDVFLGSYHGGRDRDINSFIYWNRQGRFSFYDREHLFTHSCSGCVAADFNDDGFVDLAVANHKTWGDHTSDSYVWWNGPDGFNPHRITKLPTEGPHGMTALEPGNILDRGPEEYYISTPHKAEAAGRIKAAKVEAELPPKTWTTLLFRKAATEAALADAPWQEADAIDFQAGDLLQYRLALGAHNSLRTPRVTAVEVTLEVK